MKIVALIPVLALTACTTTGGGIPLLTRDPPLDPVEGLEHRELIDRAHAAVLSAHGDLPIDILVFPEKEHRLHPVRADVVALAGPDRAGRFLYALRDPDDVEPGILLRRANIDFRDDFPVARVDRRIDALALSSDGAHAALLFAQPEGGPLRDLALVDVERGTVDLTKITAFPATPSWLDDGRLALITLTDDGREVHIFDPRTGELSASLGSAHAVRAEPGSKALLTTTRDENDLITLTRVPLDGGAVQKITARGVFSPLAVLDDGMLVTLAAPTLGATQQWEVVLSGPVRPLANVKLYDLATGKFATVEPRASLGRMWSAGALGNAPISAAAARAAH